MGKKTERPRLWKFLICFLGSLAMLWGILLVLRWGIGTLANIAWKNPLPGTVQTGEHVNPDESGALPPDSTATGETETVPPATEQGEAVVTVIGDIMSHKPVINAGLIDGTYCYDEIFQYITDYTSQADFAIANLETTLAGTEGGYEYSGYPQFNCPDAIVDAMKAAGFDMLLTANNHSYDTRAYGLNRTLEVIADRELVSLGTTLKADDPDYLIQEIGGIKVGMVCYTYGVIDGTTGQKAVNGIPISQQLTEQINVFDYDRLDQFYEEMEQILGHMEAEGAEATVLFIHWGNEYQLTENSYQKTIAQKMCNMGIDVIIGGHPHVVQPVEMLTSETDSTHKTFCAYSLGNAVSNQRAANMRLNTGHTEDGLMVSFCFVRDEDGQVELDWVKAMPCWVNMRSGSRRSYMILPLDEAVEDWQSAYDLSASEYTQAKVSYERTLKIIGSGMEEAESWLENQAA